MSDPSSLTLFASTATASATHGLPLALAGLAAWPLILLGWVTGMKAMKVRQIRGKVNLVYSGGQSRRPGRVLKPVLNARGIGLVQIRPNHPRR